jgi:hypothetical protein
MSESNRSALEHLSEELAEAYSMNRLSEGQAASVEEHLLVCEVCRTKVEETDEFVRVIRSALETKQEEEQRQDQAERREVKRPFWNVESGWAVTFAAVAVLLVVALVPHPRSGTAVEVPLRAVRAEAASIAPAGRTLVFKADRKGSPESRGYFLQVVSSSGSTIAEAAGVSAGEDVTAQFGKGLRAGRYWVRLLNQERRLLREYDLKVE